MFSSLRIALILVVLASAGGGILYVKKLQNDLDTAKGNIIKKDDPFYEKNPDNDPLVKLAKDAEKKASKKPRRKRKPKAKK